MHVNNLFSIFFNFFLFDTVIVYFIKVTINFNYFKFMLIITIEIHIKRQNCVKIRTILL